MAEREIARLEEKSALSGGGVFAVVMLSLGSALMLLSMGDNSAIRGAMYAAAWTGWNVLWGAVLINGKRTNYTVYRNEP